MAGFNGNVNADVGTTSPAFGGYSFLKRRRGSAVQRQISLLISGQSAELSTLTRPSNGHPLPACWRGEGNKIFATANAKSPRSHASSTALLFS
jgi:hypothetical protein